MGGNNGRVRRSSISKKEDYFLCGKDTSLRKISSVYDLVIPDTCSTITYRRRHGISPSSGEEEVECVRYMFASMNSLDNIRIPKLVRSELGAKKFKDYCKNGNKNMWIKAREEVRNKLLSLIDNKGLVLPEISSVELYSAFQRNLNLGSYGLTNTDRALFETALWHAYQGHNTILLTADEGIREAWRHLMKNGLGKRLSSVKARRAQNGEMVNSGVYHLGARRGVKTFSVHPAVFRPSN